MSIPRNHHYVSQALSRNFLSEEGRLFKVSKSEKRIREVMSTKSLFSQRDLNSTIDEYGNLDHKTVETALNQYFETDFPTHSKIILDALNTECEVGQVVPNTENIKESIEYLLAMALIGPFRHPNYIQETEQVIFGVLNEISSNAIPELENAIYYEMNRLSEVTNKVMVDFNELKQGIFELMGDIKYGVMRAPENHFFILPDCSAGIQRFQMPSDFIDGIEYINPSMPIGMALMPINSKVILTAVLRAEDNEDISDYFKFNFDFEEGSERNREVKHRFLLNNKATGKYKNQRVKLVLEEPVDGTSKWKHYKDYFYTLNISFTNDFDEF